MSFDLSCIFLAFQQRACFLGWRVILRWRLWHNLREKYSGHSTLPLIQPREMGKTDTWINKRRETTLVWLFELNHIVCFTNLGKLILNPCSGSILSSSQFPPLPQKLKIAWKLVEIESEIVISFYISKSVKLTVAKFQFYLQNAGGIFPGDCDWRGKSFDRPEKKKSA